MDQPPQKDQQIDPRTRFLNAYANLPIGARQQIVAVLDEGPVTWQVAYFEIKNETPSGKKVLEQLEKLKII